MHEQPILIGYDGSEGAKRAVEFAGRFFRGRHAIVATAASGEAGSGDAARTRAATEALAEEGAAAARAVGIDAAARAIPGTKKPWQALVAAASDADAAVIIVGSHGYKEGRPLVLGSVSHQLGHLADRPVLVVPTLEAIAARRAQNAKADNVDADHRH